ncbi:MAG: AMP-dependent synthetase, partial [Pseudomonadota bacterium]|nr:AMP-dependent synthetase [Pseudomonadota bacterium]
ANDDLKANIQEHVRTRLAAYEYPREIEFIDELPMTTTGKIMRRELRRRETEKGKDPNQ